MNETVRIGIATMEEFAQQTLAELDTGKYHGAFFGYATPNCCFAPSPRRAGRSSAR